MIFNLFKYKPTLKELIPKDFIDIHSHILPNIDDGSKNVQESVLLIEKMKEMGFSKIIATPHTYAGLYQNTNDTIKESFNEIKNKIPSDVNVLYASEYLLDSSLIEKAEEKSILCLHSNYVLVEMSYLSPPNNLYEIIFKLQLNGYIPILAHPERYYFLHEDFKKYYELKRRGCKFQMNLLSSTFFYGKKILNISNKLLELDLINFVGSDIHNTKHIESFNLKVLLGKRGEFEKLINNNYLFD